MSPAEEQIRVLQDQNALLVEEVNVLKANNDELKNMNQKLEDQLRHALEDIYLLRRKVFGSSREKMPDDTMPLGLYADESADAGKADPPSVTHVEAHDRKKSKAEMDDALPESLPRKECILRNEEAEKAGWDVIGQEISERLAVHSEFYVIRFIRLKYADKAHPEKGVMIAPVPGNYFNTVSSKAKYDVSFVAKVISDKYENAIPLERQSTMLAREGINVNSSTMGFLAEQAADRLKPLFELMGKQTMDCEVLHVDETSFKLQEKGRKNCRSVWMWCRVTEVGPPMVVFHFAKSRSKQIAQETLGQYLGTIIRDSYAGYNDLPCGAACCWVHVRRYFYKAFILGYTKAEEFISIIDMLFELERQAKRQAEQKGTETALFNARKTIRRKDSTKIVDTFFDKCRAMANVDRPSSKFTEAVRYALNIESELRMFLSDPKLTMDNNTAERMIRSLTIIRKNSLFTGSEKGGNTLAVLYSFAKTCQANKVSFRKWLEDVLVRIGTTPESELNTLLPHNWSQQTP